MCNFAKWLFRAVLWIKYRNDISGSFTYGWFLKLFDTLSYKCMCWILIHLSAFYSGHNHDNNKFIMRRTSLSTSPSKVYFKLFLVWKGVSLLFLVACDLDNLMTHSITPVLDTRKKNLKKLYLQWDPHSFFRNKCG